MIHIPIILMWRLQTQNIALHMWIPTNKRITNGINSVLAAWMLCVCVCVNLNEQKKKWKIAIRLVCSVLRSIIKWKPYVNTHFTRMSLHFILFMFTRLCAPHLIRLFSDRKSLDKYYRRHACQSFDCRAYLNIRSTTLHLMTKLGNSFFLLI